MAGRLVRAVERLVRIGVLAASLSPILGRGPRQGRGTGAAAR